MFLVKMRCLGWVPIQYAQCPYRKEKFGHRGASKGECHVKPEVDIMVLSIINLQTNIPLHPKDTLIGAFFPLHTLLVIMAE